MGIFRWCEGFLGREEGGIGVIMRWGSGVGGLVG